MLPRLSIDRAEHRALLARIASSARPVTTAFGARDYGSTVLWYWANFYRDGLFYAEHEDAIVVAEHKADVLRICDVLSAHDVDLMALLPRVATRLASRVELGFGPESITNLAADPARTYEEAPLFVRGAWPPLPPSPFKHPLLAQT